MLNRKECAKQFYKRNKICWFVQYSGMKINSQSKFKNQYNMHVLKKNLKVFVFFKSGKLMMKVHFEKYRDDTCQEYFE